MRDPKNAIIVVLTITAFLLFAKGCKDSNSIVLSDTSALEKIIVEQQELINKQQAVINLIDLQRDSLVFTETRIKYQYHDIYVLNSTASLGILDSLIRDNSDLSVSDTLHLPTDSLKCYNKEELRSISNRLIRANECDTLLKISEKDCLYANEIINIQKEIIQSKDTQLVAFDNIVTAKNADILALQEENFHDGRKAKWLRIGWLSTSGVLGSLLVIQLLK